METDNNFGFWSKALCNSNLLLANCSYVFECEWITRQATQAKDIAFYINGIALGCIICADDQDDAVVSYNIKKAMKAWYGMQHILSAHGADPCTILGLLLSCSGSG